MTTIETQYSSPISMTISLASITSGNARESLAVDNSVNKYLDAMVYLAIKLQSGAPSTGSTINVWFNASVDGTNYTDNATGADAALALRTVPGFFGPFSIPHTVNGETVKATIPSVARFFGGVLPMKWSIIVENQATQAFSATGGDHTKEYVGIAYTTVA